MLQFAQSNHLVENPPVLVQKKIFRLQFFDGGIQGMIVQQDGAEHAAFRFKILGKLPFECEISSHRVV